MRSGSYSQLDRHAHSGDEQRDASHDDTEYDAHEDREQVRGVELLFFISEKCRHIIDRTTFSHDDELVSQLESEIT